MHAGFKPTTEPGNEGTSARLRATVIDLAPPPAERIGPVPGGERITVIDCLRGAALLGIIIANMRGFNAPMAAYFQPNLMWTGMPDRIAQALVDWLVQGKFITIFATLFGVGFAIQMDRAVARGLGLSFYARRMLALLLIGLVHSFALWWGDILTAYAICGLFLMFFRKRTQKTILIWGHIMYWFLLVLVSGLYIATLFGLQLPDPPKPDLAKIVQIYAHGSVREIFFMRADEWAQANSFILILTNILGLHLFGLYVWRQGYLQRPAEFLDWWRKAQRVGLIVGIIGNAIIVTLNWIFQPNPMHPTLPSVVMLCLHWIAVPALSLGYSATIVMLWQHPVWQQRLMPFSYVGRMALTNYLMQSLVCTTIFYSYGLGLYGRVGPLLDLFLAILIYSLQVPFSKWWLSSHRFGPMEWVWRRLTYGRLAAP
jgi:uncharacterized protein